MVTKHPACVESVAFCVLKLKILALVGPRSRATHTLQLINCYPTNATVTKYHNTNYVTFSSEKLINSFPLVLWVRYHNRCAPYKPRTPFSVVDAALCIMQQKRLWRIFLSHAPYSSVCETLIRYQERRLAGVTACL